jgi:hypothetical protein
LSAGSSEPPPLVLLGPQRFTPTLCAAVDELGVDGPVAAVTAGWQDREGEDRELADHLGGRLVNLELYRRCEEVFTEDPELFEAHRRRQDRLKALQRLYRLRLDHALAAVRALVRREGFEPDLLEPEIDDAVATVQALDQRHLAKVRSIDRRFEQRWRPTERPAVARQRREVAERLGDCAALAVAGGHVAVLLNRMRLFGVAELARALPVVAWSAGAMTLAERIVLFHDSPPQGAGNAEMLEHGLGRLTGVLPLPHAARRLRLDDPLRVSIFARRLAPAVPVTLDGGAKLVLAGSRLVAAAGVRRLCPDGRLETVEPAAVAIGEGA